MMDGHVRFFGARSRAVGDGNLPSTSLGPKGAQVDSPGWSRFPSGAKGASAGPEGAQMLQPRVNPSAPARGATLGTKPKNEKP
jgi:hypothetical protein